MSSKISNPPHANLLHSFLVAFRFLLGVFESVVTPAGMRWIRYHCAENQRGLAVGLYMAAAKVGPALGAPLATWLLVAYGWRYMFVVGGTPALLVAFMRRGVHEPDRWKRREELALIYGKTGQYDKAENIHRSWVIRGSVCTARRWQLCRQGRRHRCGRS